MTIPLHSNTPVLRDTNQTPKRIKCSRTFLTPPPATRQCTPSTPAPRSETLMDSLTPIKDIQPSLLASTPTTLTDILKPVITSHTTSFFDEHVQMMEGLQRARRASKLNNKPTTHIKPVPQKQVPKKITSMLSKWLDVSKPSKLDTPRHTALILYNHKYQGLQSAHNKPMNSKYKPYTGLVHLHEVFCMTIVDPHKTTPS